MLFRAVAFVVPVQGKGDDRVLLGREILSAGSGRIDDAETLRVAIADGMSNPSGGDRAARAALDAIARDLRAEPSLDFETARAALDRANDAFIAEGTGAGSTILALFAWGGGHLLVSAGDSVAYLARGRVIFRTSEPQAVGSALTSLFGGAHPCLDLERITTPEALEPGDRLLLASDGLLAAVDAKLVKAVLREAAPLHEVAERLRLQVEGGQPPDDTSVVLVEVVEEEPARGL